MKQVSEATNASNSSFWSVDPRALSLFRIIFTILLIIEWVDRWTFRVDFIAASGLTPVSLTFSGAGHYSLANLFEFTKRANLVNVYLILGLISYVLLLFGLFTKFACTAALFFYSSLLISNPALRNFGDHVVVLALLWGIFAGLGDYFSLDKFFNLRVSQSRFGKEVIFAQFALIVLGAGLAKTGNTWQSGDALAHILSSPVVSSQLGQSLALWGSPSLLKILCWSSVFIEVVCPVLILLPYRSLILRRVSVALMASLWVGIILFLAIGVGPWIMLASTLIFLDTKIINLKFSNTISRPRSLVKRSLLLEVIQLPLVIISLTMFVHFILGTRFDVTKNKVPSALLVPFNLLGITQEWIMFAPDPYMTIQWPQVRANLEDGRQIDIITGKSIETNRIVLPENLPRIKRKYFEFLGKSENQKYRNRFLELLCQNSSIFPENGSKVISAEFFIINKKLQATYSLPSIEADSENIHVELAEQIICRTNM